MCEQLNYNNYEVWSAKMKMILVNENLWDCIEPGNNMDEKMNLEDLAQIIMMIDDNQLFYVLDAKNGKEAWEFLENLHQNHSVGRKLRLYRKLFKT